MDVKLELIDDIQIKEEIEDSQFAENVTLKDELRDGIDSGGCPDMHEFEVKGEVMELKGCNNHKIIRVRFFFYDD